MELPPNSALQPGFLSPLRGRMSKAAAPVNLLHCRRVSRTLPLIGLCRQPDAHFLGLTTASPHMLLQSSASVVEMRRNCSYRPFLLLVAIGGQASGTTSRTFAPAANSTSRIICPFRTDRSAVRCSLSSPFMIPHASPSVIAHPCFSHFHLEHERRQVLVSRRVPCASGCSLFSRSSSAARRSSCSSGVTISPFHDMETIAPWKVSSHCRSDGSATLGPRAPRRCLLAVALLLPATPRARPGAEYAGTSWASLIAYR